MKKIFAAFTSIGLSLVFSLVASVAASYLLRMAMSAQGTPEPEAEQPRRPAVSNRNPVVVIVMPVLIGNSGNSFGPSIYPNSRGRGWRRR